ncbi:hypothetical protein GGI00_002444, partial [Coemansia sp. RSA 2681]
YVADAAGNFACLDGKRSIPFSQVNDDYCDCADGSDEPGTSACNNGTFYCANRGHTPARISSAKVNNGVCDAECCDGSDEYDSGVQCPDRCAEVGRQARAEAESRLLREGAGSRRRMELVRQARGLRKTKRDELARKERRLAEAVAAYDGAEARKAALEEREGARARERSDRLAELRSQRLPDLIAYRRALAGALHRMRAHRDSLILLLRSVRVGHNAEYNDAAVARMLADYAGFTDAYPYIEAAALEYADEGSKARAEREQRMDDDSRADDADFDACRAAADICASEHETLADDISTLADMLRALRDGYNRNYHDLHVKAAVVGFADYEADAASASAQPDEAGVEAARQRFADATAAVDALAVSSVPIAPPIAPPIPHSMAENDAPPPIPHSVAEGDDAAASKELEDARAAYWAAHAEKGALTSDVAALKALLDDADLGPDDVYLPLKDECVSLDTGEYTYEVCILDRAAQISNKDQSRQNLGSFAGLSSNKAANGDGDGDVVVHKYQHGAKCWNGPERSLTAYFVCADTLSIASITEPEKCEYVAQMAGPFACAPIVAEEKDNANRPPPPRHNDDDDDVDVDERHRRAEHDEL